jgi:hypothetical protein
MIRIGPREVEARDSIAFLAVDLAVPVLVRFIETDLICAIPPFGGLHGLLSRLLRRGARDQPERGRCRKC